MSIKITMRDSKYRLGIQDEVWEFESAKEFQEVLQEMIKLKERNGKNVNKNEW